MEDCFAYMKKDEKGHAVCYCLNKLYCKEGNCHFYKPKTEISRAEIELDIKNRGKEVGGEEKWKN